MTHNTAGGCQTIAATVVVSGPQIVSVDSHGAGGQGSYVSVSTPDIMITVHDRRAMKVYAGVWSTFAYAATLLPQSRPALTEQRAERNPGIVVAAFGQDDARGVYRPDQRDLRIRLGYLTWVVRDMKAFADLAGQWEVARQLGEIILPPLPPL